MGDFRVTVEALGGHGCQREKGDGETVVGCDKPGCPDCMAREFVRRLKRSGAQVKVAQIRHWPADLPGYTPEGEVRDDLLTGARTGAFPERERYLAQERAADSNTVNTAAAHTQITYASSGTTIADLGQWQADQDAGLKSGRRS